MQKFVVVFKKVLRSDLTYIRLLCTSKSKHSDCLINFCILQKIKESVNQYITRVIIFNKATRGKNRMFVENKKRKTSPYWERSEHYICLWLKIVCWQKLNWIEMTKIEILLIIKYCILLYLYSQLLYIHL